MVPLLLCAHLSAPFGALAQSVQLTPPAKPNTLPDIAPNIPPSSAKDKHPNLHLLNDHLPEAPSIAPTFTIPVGTLGFTSPGPYFFGQGISMASLGFLGEDHLLFTFRIPGLIRRDGPQKERESERQIQAVVLEVKTGRVEAEALWTVHDRKRYLWMLKDGRFLLRDRDGLEVGDNSLVLKPSLQFPGSVQWLEMDPQQLYMVTNSNEPTKADPKPGQVDSPATAAATIDVDGPTDSTPADMVVRILERNTGKVMLVSRVHSTVHLPINADGYLERIRGNGQIWLLNLKFFTGGSRILGRVESSCSPVFDFISQRELLVTGCTPWGANRLTGFTTDGRRLWEEDTTIAETWPIASMGPDGSRMIFETLETSHPMGAYNPVDLSDVRGQLVRIINAADGTVALQATATPPLDAGGNVAISPTGKRAAILINGAIQVFDLPPAPTIPAPSTGVAAR
jgi:hypothetical protein